MARFKKALKYIGLAILIILASTGIGLFGAVPIISSNKRQETSFKIELLEEKKEEEDLFEEIEKR